MDAKEKAEWLAGIKVGDECAMRSSNFYGEPYYILKVVKITATQLVMTRGTSAVTHRARRDTGRVIGKSYTSIEPATNSIREVNEMARLSHWVQGLSHNYKHLTADQLRRMKAIADERP